MANTDYVGTAIAAVPAVYALKITERIATRGMRRRPMKKKKKKKKSRR